jgi:hypothetical protein
MLNNTLTCENPDQVAQALVDALTGDQVVPGFDFEDEHKGLVDGDEEMYYTVALVLDLGRDKWVTVNSDWYQSSVLEFDTRADAEADVFGALENYQLGNP